MSHEDYSQLITPTGELILKDKNLSSLHKPLLNQVGERILHLDLRNNKISYLENLNLPHLTHLRFLDLRSNKLEMLTEKISLLPHLKTLKLDNNLLTTLPQSLFKLPLSTLSLSNNSLFSVPSQISNLQELTYLNLSENQIQELPDEIGEISQLKIFHIHKNEFASLPVGMADLHNLEELSLEWFRYTLPQLTKTIKGELGMALLSILKDLMKYYRNACGSQLPLEIFLKHFSESDFHVNRIDVRQKNLMHYAAASGDIGVIKGLIGSGCNLDQLDVDGFSPLVVALKEDNLAAAKVIMQAGARLDIGAGAYGSVLNLAVIKSEPWLVSSIIKAGADVNTLDNDGSSCMHHLMTVFKKHKHKNTLIADMLIDSGVKLNTYNQDNWSAVHIAARKAQNSAFRWMTKKNKELESKNIESFNLNLLGGSHGWSPLHIAAHTGNYKTVEILLECGANVYIKSYDGKTPKDTSKGDLSIFKFLSRFEKNHIKLMLKTKNKEEDLEIGFRGIEESYRKLYEFYACSDIKEIESMLTGDESLCVKTDAVYLLSLLKQRKAAKLLMLTVESEDTLLKNEAVLALDMIKGNKAKISKHSLIGPKLPRTTPLQMSLPVNMSTLIEEETRNDTLLMN